MMQNVPLYLVGLALILIVLGLIRLTMTIFGLKRLQALDEKFQLKIGKMGLTIQTHYLGLACISLGFMMAIISFWVSGYFGQAGEAYAEDARIPTTCTVHQAKYRVSEEEIRIDLRNREEIAIPDYLAGNLSETERLVTRRIKDVGKRVKKIQIRHATSGYRIKLVEKPQGATWTRYEDKAKVLHNPFISLLRGKHYAEVFKDILARHGEIKSYCLDVPITSGKGQEIFYRLSYANAFQGGDFEWAGKVFDADTDVLTMHITFPKDKPIKSSETFRRSPASKKKERLENPEIEIAHGNRVLTWRIHNGKKGEKYYIKWLW